MPNLKHLSLNSLGIGLRPKKNAIEQLSMASNLTHFAVERIEEVIMQQDRRT